MPGLVPLYEEREASVFAHYNWTEWTSLHWRERAAVVAHYRTHRQIELHHSDVVARETRRRAPKNP